MMPTFDLRTCAHAGRELRVGQPRYWLGLMEAKFLPLDPTFVYLRCRFCAVTLLRLDQGDVDFDRIDDLTGIIVAR